MWGFYSTNIFIPNDRFNKCDIFNINPWLYPSQRLYIYITDYYLFQTKKNSLSNCVVQKIIRHFYNVTNNKFNLCSSDVYCFITNL